MATFIVTNVRKELSTDRSHSHIAGVRTSSGTYHTRQEVVASITAGNAWKTQADGREATIKVRTYCPHSGCLATPYIETNPDSTEKDNLENLEPC